MPVPLNVTSGFIDAFTTAFVNVILIPPNVTPSSANAFGSTPPIRQESITPHPANAISSIPPMRQETITSYPTNALGSISPIYQLTITPGPAQISLIPPPDWSQQAFNAYENLYIQISPIKVPSKMLSATIIAQFVKIWDKNLNYNDKVYDILDDKFWYFFDNAIQSLSKNHNSIQFFC